MDLNAALERYARMLAANGRSTHTVKQSQRHIRLLARWLKQERRSDVLDDIDEDVVARFLTSDMACRTAKGARKTPGSVNALRSSLKTFFGAATRTGWLSQDPARFVKRAICSPPPPRALTTKEEGRMRAVLEAAEGPEAERDRVLVEVMLGTGIRLSSALGLDVEDVDLDEGVLHLRRVKGGRCERVFLAPGIRDVLGQFLGDRVSGPVFARQDGERISTRHAQRRIRQWRERAGISRAISAHSMRHTFGQRLYDRTRDLLLVKAALGHRSISSTLVYAHAPDDRLRVAMAER